MYHLILFKFALANNTDCTGTNGATHIKRKYTLKHITYIINQLLFFSFEELVKNTRK